MGLRFRLNLLLSLIFSLALAIAVTYLLADARRAVVDELHASTLLASTLIEGMLRGPLSQAEETGIDTTLAQLEAQVSLRHLRIEFIAPGSDATRSLQDTGGPAFRVPAWFARLVRPQAGIVTQSVAWRGGEIVIAADPADEIAEAWRETRTMLYVLVAVFAGALLVVFTFLGRALRPLQGVSSALEGVERGNYRARLPVVGLPDIDAISERFNHMASALERSDADNALLAQRSLAIQEDERRYLAHELHDEMGQSITAIKALAVSIRERTAVNDTTVADRAATIIDVSSEIYARVRRMMTRLHPVVLDELGLETALELMIDDWNSHHEDCFCRYVATRNLPPLSQTMRINLYRIVQEALTNIVRHARADAAEVALALEVAASPCIALAVSDNGVGFEPTARLRGLGLAGMRERVDALGGCLELVTAPGAGTTVRVRVPLARTPITLEREADGHAHTSG